MKREVAAMIFDLDGVVTETALVHSAAWKMVFDEVLKEHYAKKGEAFVPFTHEGDYIKYVDGKPRYEGVRSFLESRGIELPYGDPSDSGDKNTICGVGNRKNDAFNAILKRDGVRTYPTTVALIKQLRKEGVRVAVASSSKNCGPVLEAAGISDLIESRVDGVVSAELGLKGKPQPDIFVKAAENLGVPIEKSVVVEDAVSGVQAGHAGKFGLVLGIAREGNAESLIENGADIAVSDIGEITLDEIDSWFKNADAWKVTYTDYDKAKERSREALLAVGNGYVCSRGAFTGVEATPNNYPGTYIAGVFNRRTTPVAGRDLENEDLVNVINWLPVTFKIGDSEWFDINTADIKDIKRTLDMRTGVLYSEVTVEDGDGRSSTISSKRLISMSTPHLAAIEYTVTPNNYTAELTFKAGLYGNHINAGVERYKQLNQEHLKPSTEGGSANTLELQVETTQSGIKVAGAAKVCVVGRDNTEFSHKTSPAVSETECKVVANMEEPVTFRKVVALYTTLDSKNPSEAAKNALQDVCDITCLQESSAAKWRALWDKIDIKIEGDTESQRLLRLNLFHTMASVAPNMAEVDAGIGARGLHGEAYRGHIFWDELYIIPFLSMECPESAKAALMYRYRRLDAARKYAKDNGYKGAMYPWQSGSDGREETQIMHLNPVSGEWGPDNSCLQRHVSLAIAYNTWIYCHITHDEEFLTKYGMEMLLEICRFWASAATYDEKTGEYHICKVMGPDEFHEAYPGAKEGGLRDNAYTNVVTSWLFRKVAKLVAGGKFDAVMKKISMTADEVAKWQEIAKHLHITIKDGVLAQFDGYFDLKELDWDAYRAKYGNIYRLDRILKAEGDSPDEYKLSKQADALMMFYILGEDEVRDLLKDMGFNVPADYLTKNFDYYFNRTSHGSTLSRVVHAVVASKVGKTELGWPLYQEALGSDFVDIQGGTTAEGIHLGVMTGTAWSALATYAGLELSGDTVKLNPSLPSAWNGLAFGFSFQGNRYQIRIFGDKTTIFFNGKDAKASVEIAGAIYVLNRGEVVNVMNSKECQNNAA